MKRLLTGLLLGAAALAPGLLRAQEKPSLNTAPPAPAPVQPAPAQPTYAPEPQGAVIRVPADTVRRPAYTPPAGYDQPTRNGLPTPSANSPSGYELPGREQARKAAQEHADMYTKFFVYSGVGLGYTSYNGYGQFNASISPALGYRLNDRVAIGPGISYAYSNYSFGQGTPSLSLNNIGVKVFGQVQVYRQFLVHAEYEVTRAELPLVDQNGYYLQNPNTNQILTGTRTIDSPLAGIGYRSQFSNRAAADILVLYNFNDSFNNSLYTNPVIRFNFLFNIGR